MKIVRYAGEIIFLKLSDLIIEEETMPKKKKLSND